jgi:integrase
MSEIRRVKLDQWMRGLAASGIPSPSIRYAASVLSNILKMAVDYELIDRNPVSSLKLPAKSPKRERVLSVDQAAELLENCRGTDMAAPVFLAAVLGLRRGEIAGLKWSDLDRQRGELRIVRQRRASKGNGVIEKKLKTSSSKRTLRLTKGIVAEIDARGNLDADHICTRLGKPWVPDTITEQWVASRKEWKLEGWTFHDLRHGAAGLLYATGADIIEIAAVLGHKKADMTLTYTSAGNDRAASAIKGLGTALKLVDK